MAGLKFDITGDNGNMLSALHGVQKGVRQTQQVVEQSGHGIEQMFEGIKSAAVSALGAFSAQQFASKVMNVRGQFQQLEVAFETMLGNADDANRLMTQLVKTAAVTPFDLQGVANGAKQLLAYGIQADDVNETLVRLGDIAAGLSMPLNDLVYLYGTTMVQGRMFTMDLRQFQGRGIPIADELAKQFGVAKEKVGELVTAGKVGAEEMKKAIISMTSEGGKFAGLMEKQSHTITGQISNIEDAIDNMFNEIGKQSEGGINTGLSLVSKLVENWETVARVLGTVATAYGISKAAIIAYNVYQTIHNRLLQEAALQSKLAAMNNITLSNSEAMAAARTTLFSASIKGLTAAIAANPVGALTVGLTTLLSVIQLVNTDTDKMAVYTDKFGKDAATTLTTLDTYANTLLGLSEGHDKLKLSGSTSKKVLEELNAILSDYGITQIKEGDNIDSVNAKREQAIQLIKEESIERQRLNDIDAVSQEYQQAIQDAQNQLMNDLSNAVYNKTGDTLLNKIFGSADEIRENSSAISMIIGDVVRNNMGLIVNKSGEEYDKGMDQIRSKIQERMKKIGLSDEAIKSQWADNSLLKADDIILKYVNSVQNATEAQDRHLDMVNKSAEAERNAASASMDYGDKVAALERKLQGPTDGVHQLYKNIRELMSQYKDNTIGFHINFDGKFPSWMGKMGIPELERLSKRFAAIGANLKDGGSVLVNGRRYTKQQALQRSADYAEAAENKQTKQDEKEKEAKRKAEEEAKNNESKKKNYASEAKRRKEEERREKERIAEEIRGRNKAIKDYENIVLEQQKETELAIRQQNIDLKEESYEKEIEQTNLNYDRLIAENEKRRKDMIEALKDNKVNEWLNKNPKAKKARQDAYRNSLNLTDSDLTATQNAQLAEYDAIAEKQKAKAQKDLYTKLLGEFQDYEARRTQINSDFDKKRKDLEAIPADTKGREQAIEELEKKRKESIKSVNDEEISKIRESSTLFIDLFGDAADKSDKEIRKIITETEELLSYLKNTKTSDITPDFGFTTEQLKALKASPEQIKAITEQLERLKQAAKSSNPFKQLAEDLKNLFSKNKDDKGESTEAKLKKLGASASETADLIGGIASKLSDMYDAAGNTSMAEAMETLSDAMTSVSNIGRGFAQGGVVGGITAAAGEAIGIVTKAFQASARHAEALKKIQQEVLSQQRAYNLALLEEKLNFEQSVTVFGNLDYTKAVNAVDVLREAYVNLNSELRGTTVQQKKFRNGIVILGKRFGEYSRLQQGYSGLADIQIKTGHKKTGFMGWGKGKDLYSSILDVYPQLVDSAGNFNKKLAESIIGSREFNGEGKEALQNMINLYDKTQEAAKQLKDYLSGIFGDLGNNMTDALVDAFKNGTDAGKAFGDSISKMLENIGKQMIFQTLFSGIIEDANNKMLDVMKNQSMSADNKFKNYVDILDTMTSQILGRQDTFNNLMSRYKGIAADKGISLFGSESEQQSASANGSLQISYEQATNLIALITAGNISRDQIKDIVSTVIANVGSLATFSSSTNTAVLEIKNLMVYNNSYLEDILKCSKSIYTEFAIKLDSVNKNLKDIK